MYSKYIRFFSRDQHQRPSKKRPRRRTPARTYFYPISLDHFPFDALFAFHPTERRSSFAKYTFHTSALICRLQMA